MRELLSRSPRLRRRFAGAVALGAAAGTTGVLGFVAVAYGVGELLAPVPRTGVIAGWVVAAAVALLASFTARWLADRVAHHASYDLEVLLRRALADVLARLPLGDVARAGTGRIKKVMHDDVRSLHVVTADALPFAGSAIAQPLAAIVALGVVQWRLLLLALVVLPVAMLCLALMSRDYGSRISGYNRANEEVNSAVVEFAQGMPVVRAFDDGRVSFRRFATAVHGFTVAIADWLAAARRPGTLQKLFVVPLPTLLVVAAGGAAMLAAGWVTLPELVLALLVGAMPIEAVAPLMQLNNLINESRAGALRVAELLEMPPLPEPEHPRLPADGSVVLSGVRFSYGAGGDRARPALDGVDLDIPAGTVCALVGPSGAGKSTVARLIPRFHDVDAGSIRIGGVDVREMETDVLLRHVALVFQEPFLIDATVAENIRLGDPSATDEQVVAAATEAAAHEFISTELTGGYDAPVGERGSRLSGGQRQRITIARAILSRAPIVVLDEATAFTDPENEVAVQAALARLTRGRTVVVVAHRLSTIADADQIAVLDGGRIVERGRHHDLVAAGGRYAQLWARHEEAARWGLTARPASGAARPATAVSSGEGEVTR